MGNEIMRSTLVEQIWNNSLHACQDDSISPLARMLQSLLPHPVACFYSTSGYGFDEPIAMYGLEEVLPGATLADILDQECGIEISDDTIVLVESAKTRNAPHVSAQKMGLAMGNILVSLAKFEESCDAAHHHVGDGYSVAQKHQMHSVTSHAGSFSGIRPN